MIITERNIFVCGNGQSLGKVNLNCLSSKKEGGWENLQKPKTWKWYLWLLHVAGPLQTLEDHSHETANSTGDMVPLKWNVLVDGWKQSSPDVSAIESVVSTSIVSVLFLCCSQGKSLRKYTHIYLLSGEIILFYHLLFGWNNLKLKEWGSKIEHIWHLIWNIVVLPLSFHNHLFSCSFSIRVEGSEGGV